MVCLPPELYEAVKVRAAETDQRIAQVVRAAVREYLTKGER